MSPFGVRIANAHAPEIEWLTLINSTSNAPALIRSPGTTTPTAKTLPSANSITLKFTKTALGRACRGQTSWQWEVLHTPCPPTADKRKCPFQYPISICPSPEHTACAVSSMTTAISLTPGWSLKWQHKNKKRGTAASHTKLNKKISDPWLQLLVRNQGSPVILDI